MSTEQQTLRFEPGDGVLRVRSKNGSVARIVFCAAVPSDLSRLRSIVDDVSDERFFRAVLAYLLAEPDAAQHFVAVTVESGAISVVVSGAAVLRYRSSGSDHVIDAAHALVPVGEVLPVDTECIWWSGSSEGADSDSRGDTAAGALHSRFDLLHGTVPASTCALFLQSTFLQTVSEQPIVSEQSTISERPSERALAYIAASEAEHADINDLPDVSGATPKSIGYPVVSALIAPAAAVGSVAINSEHAGTDSDEQSKIDDDYEEEVEEEIEDEQEDFDDDYEDEEDDFDEDDEEEADEEEDDLDDDYEEEVEDSDEDEDRDGDDEDDKDEGLTHEVTPDDEGEDADLARKIANVDPSHEPELPPRGEVQLEPSGFISFADPAAQTVFFPAEVNAEPNLLSAHSENLGTPTINEASAALAAGVETQPLTPAESSEPDQELDPYHGQTLQSGQTIWPGLSRSLRAHTDALAKTSAADQPETTAGFPVQDVSNIGPAQSEMQPQSEMQQSSPTPTSGGWQPPAWENERQDNEIFVRPLPVSDVNASKTQWSAPAATAPPDDADRTVFGEELERLGFIKTKVPVQPQATTAVLAGAFCVAGHFTDAARPCLFCNSPIDWQRGVVQGERPLLGSVQLLDDRMIPVHLSVLVGRKPGDSSNVQETIAFPDDNMLSRVHLEFRAEDWAVVVFDRQSANGTEVVDPNGRATKLKANNPHALVHGAKVMFGRQTAIFHSATAPSTPTSSAGTATPLSANANANAVSDETHGSERI
jgi:FHA domain